MIGDRQWVNIAKRTPARLHQPNCAMMGACPIRTPSLLRTMERFMVAPSPYRRRFPEARPRHRGVRPDRADRRIQHPAPTHDIRPLVLGSNARPETLRTAPHRFLWAFSMASDGDHQWAADEADPTFAWSRIPDKERHWKGPRHDRGVHASTRSLSARCDQAGSANPPNNRS